MAECLLPFLAHLGVVLQQLERQADQVVEVHALVGREALLVELHHHGGAAVFVVAHGALGQCGIGVQALVLPQADGPLPLARHGGVGGAAAVLEQGQHVVAVQYAELRLQAQRGAILAQHAHAQRVKGADDHVLGGLADQSLGTLAHLCGGLVGEGDGGNALGLAAGLDQARDLVRDDPRLARAGARQHQAGAVQVVDCFLLGDVQAGGHGLRRETAMRDKQKTRRSGFGSGAGTGASFSLV